MLFFNTFNFLILKNNLFSIGFVLAITLVTSLSFTTQEADAKIIDGTATVPCKDLENYGGNALNRARICSKAERAWDDYGHMAVANTGTCTIRN